jgi:diacylglycerol kinase (ATP)
MQVALVHNPGAGDGELDRAALRRLLQDQGHQVSEFGEQKADVLAAIAGSPEVVVLAGGDGTVGRAVITAFEAGSAVPMVIVPIGTANNIARSLGVQGPAKSIINSIATSHPTRLDIGRVEGPWGNAHFVEAAGVGFIGSMLRRPPSAARRAARTVRDVVTSTPIEIRKAHGVATLIRKQELLALDIVADGEDLSGQYFGVQAMNIREVGPNLRLAPAADWGDGLLDLVLLREADREGLALRIHRRETERDLRPPRARRVKRIEMTWPDKLGHLDDCPWPESRIEAARVTITIAGAVTILRSTP